MVFSHTYLPGSKSCRISQVLFRTSALFAVCRSCWQHRWSQTRRSCGKPEGTERLQFVLIRSLMWPCDGWAGIRLIKQWLPVLWHMCFATCNPDRFSTGSWDGNQFWYSPTKHNMLLLLPGWMTTTQEPRAQTVSVGSLADSSQAPEWLDVSDYIQICWQTSTWSWKSRYTWLALREAEAKYNSELQGHRTV